MTTSATSTPAGLRRQRRLTVPREPRVPKVIRVVKPGLLGQLAAGGVSGALCREPVGQGVEGVTEAGVFVLDAAVFGVVSGSAADNVPPAGSQGGRVRIYQAPTLPAVSTGVQGMTTAGRRRCCQRTGCDAQLVSRDNIRSDTSIAPLECSWV